MNKKVLRFYRLRGTDRSHNLFSAQASHQQQYVRKAERDSAKTQPGNHLRKARRRNGNHGAKRQPADSAARTGKLCDNDRKNQQRQGTPGTNHENHFIKHMYSRSLSASTYDKKRRLRGRIRRKRSRFFCLGTWILGPPTTCISFAILLLVVRHTSCLHTSGRKCRFSPVDLYSLCNMNSSHQRRRGM